MAYKIIDNEHERCQRWTAGRFGRVGSDLVVTIGLEHDGELIAVTGYNNFVNNSCHVHFYKLDGVYVPKNYLWFVFYYAFVQAKLNSLIAFMEQSNTGIINLAGRLGFVPKHYLEDEKIMLCTMSKDHCKWLNIRFNNGIK